VNKSAAKKAKPSSKPWPTQANATCATGACAKPSKEPRSVPASRCISQNVTNDQDGKTLVSVHTTEADLRSDKTTRANVPTAVRVGKLIAERGSSKNIKKVVFDRGGYKYHGKVKSLADAAREAGFEF
jgi:large subunit ribosomal protein L18